MKKQLLLFLLLSVFFSHGQQSIARQWNEVLLEGIRNDFARPTVHARNLFHISAAMYDAWALFSEESKPYLIGNDVHDFKSNFQSVIPFPGNIDSQREMAISYCAYRLVEHRFAKSPGYGHIMQMADSLFVLKQGYEKNFTSTDYTTGSAAALGNYIAAQYIAYGLQDGSNEINVYSNQYYQPVNPALDAEFSGNATITDPNRWQPLAFEVFRDQSGNIIEGITPKFLGPEWGNVSPFSLTDENLKILSKDGNDYKVYHDPGPPPYLDPLNNPQSSDDYKWGFSLVAIWSGHLDGNLDKVIDISPKSNGNIDINTLPTHFSDYASFYNLQEGGDIGEGRDMNPITGMPYEPQIVKLGDYARVLAEFWADGPDSETPPGHWFTILNYLNDHPLLEKRFQGTGAILDDLEWDIKAYFILGGAMHDCAISAWGIKGYYDYIRPVSAIRYMADQGQSSSSELPRFNSYGIPLVDGHIELVLEGDPLVGSNNENLNKIKLWAWKGPEAINTSSTGAAGVGWILAENWWPYQRPTFITPPFAGYISGHSTFSRAAAEVLTQITGSPFFPGGMGEFDAPKNNFLVFEDGPTETIKLQWATYRDASDQCSLSRIWGGIHPPIDDLNGRRIGETIGNEAFAFSLDYFQGGNDTTMKIYPNPVSKELFVDFNDSASQSTISIFDALGRVVVQKVNPDRINMEHLSKGLYILKVDMGNGKKITHIIIKK